MHSDLMASLLSDLAWLTKWFSLTKRPKANQRGDGIKLPNVERLSNPAYLLGRFHVQIFAQSPAIVLRFRFGLLSPNKHRASSFTYVRFGMWPHILWETFTGVQEEPAATYSVLHSRKTIFCFAGFNPYPTAFPYGNGMVLHLYQQQESSTTKTVHKVINKGLKAYV